VYYQGLLKFLDLQHHLLLILLDNELHLAPIDKNVQNVLDVGTGTGIWAIEFGKSPLDGKHPELTNFCLSATRYPSASVIGSDLSPIQPDL
jgi:methylase of polypeptide subunit release factors